MNCTASVTENSCDVWVPTMEISLAHEIAMEITGLSKDQVNIHVTLLGGGFGRRLINDYVVQAVTISKELKKTVQQAIRAIPSYVEAPYQYKNNKT